MTDPRDRIRVCAVDELAPGACIRVDDGGPGIVVVRVGDEFKALTDRCSHAEYRLSDGEIDVADCTIECGKHGALFALDDGQALTLPATKPVSVHRVEIVGDDVFVDAAPSEEAIR